MAGFGLVKSFGIDSGELDGLSPQECFVLGYELSEIDTLVTGDAPLAKLVHAKNEHRIRMSCDDAGRTYRLEWMHDDPSEGWMMLYVEAG